MDQPGSLLTSRRALATGVGVGVGAVFAAATTSAEIGPPSASIAAASITALAGLRRGLTIAVLMQAGRSGTFVWNGSNLSRAVTNDPAQAIYVAPSADRSGASGAWVRQIENWLNFTWFGGVGDGVMNNATPWNHFTTYGRYLSTLGNGVNLYMPPGTYNYDHSMCQGFLQNIKTLYIWAYGVTIQNTYNQSVRGNNSAFELPWAVACQPLRNASGVLQSWFIQQTTIGADSFTLVAPANASSFNIGDYVMLASLDTQFFGFPPNTDQFEHVQITGINASAGVINIDRPIRYAHLTTYPDDAQYNNVPCGKARVWQLNTGGFSPPNPTGTVTWDINHTYAGMTVNLAPTSSLTYTSFTGRKFTILDWTGAGHSESVVQDIQFDRCEFLCQCEPDKLVNRASYKNCEWLNGVVYQSSSIDFVTMESCNLNAGISSGVAIGGKCFTASNCDINGLGIGSTDGLTRHAVLRNCRVYRYSGNQNGLIGVSATVDGTNISFSNGVFKVLKSAFSAGVGQTAVVPGGTQIVLCGPGNMFPGNAGIGLVTQYYEDATYVYIVTTLPYTSLPRWVNSGNFNVTRTQDLTFDNCSGSDNIKLASFASKQGLQPWELFTAKFYGNLNTNLGHWYGNQGTLIGVTCNIIGTESVAATFRLIAEAYDPSAFTDSGQLVITFNLGIAGKRQITPTTYTGKQTGDGITLKSVSQSYLPNVLFGPVTSVFYWQFIYSPQSYAAYQNPIIELQLQFDCGLFKKEIPMHLDGNGNYVAGVVGDLA
jgi:hypothetical protein